MSDRYRARYDVMLNLDLTPNARILYFLIDDKAGESGEMWWHWRKLAVLIGVDKGRYFELVGQLICVGALTIRREKRRVFYSVRKIGPSYENQSEKSDHSVRKIGPKDLNMNLPIEPGPKDGVSAENQTQPKPRKTACALCGDTGYVMVERVSRGIGYQCALHCECRKRRTA